MDMNNKQEESEMSDRTNIDDFLTVRGFGGGYGGYGFGGYNQGVNSPVFQHSQDNVKQKVEDQNDCTRTLFGQAFNSIQSQFEDGKRDRQVEAILKSIIDSEFRSQDRQRDSDRENAANAREITNRLCAIEKQQAVDTGVLKAEHAAILAKIEANKEIAELKAELQTQKILAETNYGCGRGTVPCNPCNGG